MKFEDGVGRIVEEKYTPLWETNEAKGCSELICETLRKPARLEQRIPGNSE